MKRVRFITPNKIQNNRMDEPECHSPRPFLERQPPAIGLDFNERILPYSNDPVQRYECSNSSPYPMFKASVPIICDRGSELLPSNDLELSMLDASNLEPRQHTICKQTVQQVEENRRQFSNPIANPQVLSPIENNKLLTPPNVLSKDRNFFLRRDDLDKYHLETNLNRLHLGKENDNLVKKTEIMTMGLKPITPEKIRIPQFSSSFDTLDAVCKCHHCIIVTQNNTPCLPQSSRLQSPHQHVNKTSNSIECNQCLYIASQPRSCFHCENNVPNMHKTCHCEDIAKCPPPHPQNAVDKKTWAIQKYEQSKNTKCMDMKKQTNVVKEKREPTVADLFKIIKLQNEQLQLLQDKVDKFISASNNAAQKTTVPIQNYMTNHVALQPIDSEMSEQHKISIGVMTSFEVVRTSTVINKEFVTQTKDNAQIQCNRSQISIKEVVAKTQPVNLNFLDGIIPVDKAPGTETSMHENGSFATAFQQFENVNDDKEINELSLYNVQVDNATTPLISPEQSMYLDFKDYSDSDSSDDQSKVGWTYYNKVMTHVNGMLHDSDMPSSASALCRNMRQQCVQIQIDKSNLSVAKRVKFGDDPLGIQQPHIYASTDTSMKMNQLAVKYLKSASPSVVPQLPTTKPVPKPDMSFATRNYMERHKLLQGMQITSNTPAPGEMPRFLDITALKQQSKLL